MRLMVVAMLLGVGAVGCSRLKATVGIGKTGGIIGGSKSNVVFPRFDTAREQYFYASQIDDKTLAGRNTAERDERSQAVIAAYQMVADHFPDDDKYTPLALASIGNCYFRTKDYRRTIRIFKSIEERYPCYPFVHAEAEWKIGRSYELLGDGREAKRHYKLCIDTFAHYKNERIKTLVALCKQQYIEPTVPSRRPRP
jgi:tetratricopeptide (TPR) repeat protein